MNGLLLPHMFEMLLLKWVVIIVGLVIIRQFFRQSFRIVGLAPIITVALVIAPVNVFLKELADLVGLPQTMGVLLAFGVVLNSLIVYGASTSVPHFYVENRMVAITIAALLSGWTLLLSYLIQSPLVTGALTSMIPWLIVPNPSSETVASPPS